MPALRQSLTSLSLALLLSGCALLEQTQSLERKNKAVTIYNSSVDLINSAKYKQALPILREAYALDSSNPLIIRALGRVLVETGKPSDGLALLIKVNQLEPNHPDTLLDLVYAYERSGNFAKAIEMMQRYIPASGNKRAAENAARLKALQEQEHILERVRALPGGDSTVDYLVFSSFESGLYRWKNGAAPLRVYIDKPRTCKNHKPHYEKLVLQALSTWEQASEGRVKFKQVSDKKRANIRCHFVDNPRELDSPVKAGETRTSYNLDGMVSANIKILTVDRRTGAEQADQEIHSTALHEIGHALGINGHSPNPGDIMFFSGGETEEMRSLSSRDIATLIALYSSEKPYVPPKGSKKEKEIEKIRAFNEHVKVYNAAVKSFNSKQYEQAIEQANEYLQLEPNADIARELIELSYNREAIIEMQKNNFDAADALLNQALNVKYKKPKKRTRAVTNNNVKYLQQQRRATAN
jgi:tetratricopeptide (TPR) repeat protein